MSMRDWLIDNQINGDDGTGFDDYKESEGENNGTKIQAYLRGSSR